MKKNSFVQGALILSAAGLISKVLGAVYRIPFANLLGSEGIGLYQMAYPIYTALLAISTGGVPVAVSIMVADALGKGDSKGANRVMFTAMGTLGLLGLGLSIGLYYYAEFIANNLLYDNRAVHSLRFISPALCFTALVSPLRGYFQGRQNMLPTAVSQVVEQVIRVITVFFGAYLLMPFGLEFAAAGATFGAVTGSIAALITLAGFCFFALSKSKNSTTLKYGVCVKRLAYLAVPVCLGGLVLPMMQGIDALIVPIRLRIAGYDMSDATAAYGELTGMAGPLINLPGVITMALAASVVPAVSAALAEGKLKVLEGRVRETIRLTILICLPAAVGLTILAKPICLTLYNLPTMGSTLATLAPAALFLGLHQASAGVLQGLGKTGLPVRNLLIGVTFKAAITYSLTGMPGWGIKGAAIGSVIGFATAALLNFSELFKLLPFELRVNGLLLKPILAGTIMTAFLAVLTNSLPVGRGTGLVLVAAGGIVYGVALLFSGELRYEEIALIPGVGTGLAKLLVNMGIVRE